MWSRNERSYELGESLLLHHQQHKTRFPPSRSLPTTPAQRRDGEDRERREQLRLARCKSKATAETHCSSTLGDNTHGYPFVLRRHRLYLCSNRDILNTTLQNKRSLKRRVPRMHAQRSGASYVQYQEAERDATGLRTCEVLSGVFVLLIKTKTI